MREITKIVVHHTGTPQKTTVESIRRYHTAILGWRDIGYHYLIQRGGCLRMGRPEEMIGAHVRGMNSYSIGVAVIGNFEEVKPSCAALKQLDLLLQDLSYRHPRATIRTHGELAKTLCPGRYLQEWIEEWRI